MTNNVIKATAKAVENTPALVINVEPTKVSTKTQSKEFADVIRKAANAYDLQMVKNCEVRLQCIEHFARQRFSNMNLFWTLYMQRADVLLDSVSFLREAKALGENPVILATNIVAHGAKELKAVSKFGIAGSGIRVEDYGCSIVPDDIVKRFMANPDEFFKDENLQPAA